MRKVGIALLGGAVLFLAPAARATTVTTGYTTVDLSHYVPGGIGNPPQNQRGNILDNPGFETGSLPPWTTNNWDVTNSDAHSGSYCAEDNGNFWIRQDFGPVPVSQITSISMWSREPQGPSVQAVDFFYGANDVDEFIVGPGSDWTLLDLTSHLRASGSLQAIRIWGYSGGGPNITHIDDVVIDTNNPVPAQASTWGQIRNLYR